MKSVIGGDAVTIHESSDFDLREFQSWVKRTQFFGLDVESLAFGHEDNADMHGPLRSRWLRMVQLADDFEAWNLDATDPVQRDAATKVFKDRTKQFTSHTAVDPIVVHACLGVDISARYYDTITLALLLVPGEFVSHGLKDLCIDNGMPELHQAEARLHDTWARLKAPAPRKPSKPKRRKADTDATHAARLKAHEETAIQEWEIRTQEYLQRFPAGWNEWRDTPSDDPTYQEYAGLDAIAVRRLWRILLEQCREKGVGPALVQELWLQQFVARMQMRGMKIDREYAQAQLDNIGSQHYRARSQFESEFGFSPLSPKRVEWLQGAGIEFRKFTPKGNPSLAKEDLKDILARYAPREGTETPLCDEQAWRALNLIKEVSSTSNLTTFVTGALKFADTDGFVHPQIRALGAETGRWTVSKPAMQTLSSKNPVRGCFIPSRPGYVIVSVDQAQIEVRVAAALAGETSLITAFNNGDDIYGVVATTLFGPAFTKSQRSVAKRVVLATLYGSGIDTIVRQLHDLDGVVVEANLVSEARRTFRRRYSRITAYSRLKNTGEDVWLPSGRYVPGDMERTYRGINSACQGTARDLLIETLRRVDAAGFGDFVLMAIHDELLFELPEAGLREALLKLKECFEVPFRAVNVGCDIEVYPVRWGDGMLVPRREGLSSVSKDAEGATVYTMERPWKPKGVAA